MRILVLGAGGIGGYFGGRLAEAGEDVTFLVRPERARRLAETGLVVESPHGNIAQPVETVTADRLARPYDVILLTCKAYDLDDAIAAIRPAVGRDSAVIPMLNGMQHLDRLDAAFGAQRVLGGFCQIGATLAPDGRVLHLNKMHLLGFGERSGETTRRADEIARHFGRGRFDTRLSSIIVLEMWEKWVMLASLAAMTCLMRGNVRRILEAQDGGALMMEALEECGAVAAAAGYAPRADFIERTKKMLSVPSDTAASMLRDIERGGPTEGDHVIGDLLARGRSLGVATPLLRVAYAHLQTYEAGRK